MKFIDHNTIKQHYSANLNERLRSDRSLRPYLMTFNFHANNARHHQHEGSRQQFFTYTERQVIDVLNYRWKQFDKIYRHITSQLMTNFTRKRHLHPVTIDFIDVPGTRNNRQLSLSSFGNTHFHSIWLLNDEVLESFECLIAEEFQSVVNHPALCNFLQQIHVEQIQSSERDIERSVSYISKIFENRLACKLNESVQLFNMYPLATSEIPKRNSRQEVIYVEQERDKQNRLRTDKRLAAANRMMTNFSADRNETEVKLSHFINTSNNQGGIVNA